MAVSSLDACYGRVTAGRALALRVEPHKLSLNPTGFDPSRVTKGAVKLAAKMYCDLYMEG